jgi:short-subunit dehydrogenase
MAQPERALRALITGASSGIGEALAYRLAARGVEVWLAARRLSLLEQVSEAISLKGGAAHVIQLDVGQTDETAERLTALDAETGGIDLVVANAGIGGKVAAMRPSRYTWPDVRELLQTNLLGATATLIPFIGPMVARGRGQLVGISSLAGSMPFPRGAVYGASKAGLTYFLRAIDVELRPFGVAVTAVLPGFIETPMTSGFRREEMPFAMPLPRAIALIDRGIQRRARLVKFPWRMAMAAAVGRALPGAITDPVVRRATLARGDRKETKKLSP